MDSLVGTLTLGSAGFAIVLLAVLLVRRDMLSKRITKRFRALSNSMYEFNSRVRVVETHAADYMNSLGPEGTRLLTELRNSMNSINLLLDEIGALLATQDIGALNEAAQLLDGTHPEQVREVRNYDGTISRRYTLPENWERQLEGMIQRAGQEVSSASMNATETGIPKRRKAQPTIFSLIRAGIRPKNGPYGW